MTLSHSKSESFRIFDAISDRYDLINTVLSGGLHYIWRKALRSALPQRFDSLRVLDLATGTADVALEVCKDERVQSVRGLDMSKGMIAYGERKVEKKGLSSKIELLVGDAQHIPFADESFEATTMSFGIRNVPDVVACLRESHRVLRSGGRCLVLEFALPRSRIIRSFHLFYLRNVLPLLGRWLSGHQTAYTYLNETIEEFPYGEDFLALMRRAGFKQPQFKSLTGGIVHLYWGDKT